MNKKFFLNDCLPQKCWRGDVYTMFKDLVTTFRNLRKKEVLNIERYWTLADSPYTTNLCQVPLKDLIEKTNDRTLKAYMWKLVSEGQPIKDMAYAYDSNPLLTMDCTFNGRDAHNLLLAKEAEMISASIPAEDALITDQLHLILKDENGNVTTCNIDNLHPLNETYIETELTPPLPSVDQPLNRLKAMFGSDKVVHASSDFMAKWNVMGLEKQKYIVRKFEDAFHANLLFPATHDEGKEFPLMKRDEKDTTNDVHELRSKGSGIRIYLECDESTLFIGLYNVKGQYSGDDQSKDFRRAKTIIGRMRQGQECAF